jgi:hypothetical protein
MPAVSPRTVPRRISEVVAYGVFGLAAIVAEVLPRPLPRLRLSTRLFVALSIRHIRLSEVLEAGTTRE